MSFSHFLRVEKQERGRTVSYILHTATPKFAIEIDPGYDPRSDSGSHFIKSLRLTNSWHGDYQRCLSLLGHAETFLRRAMDTPDAGAPFRKPP